MMRGKQRQTSEQLSTICNVSISAKVGAVLAAMIAVVAEQKLVEYEGRRPKYAVPTNSSKTKPTSGQSTGNAVNREPKTF